VFKPTPNEIIYSRQYNFSLIIYNNFENFIFEDEGQSIRFGRLQKTSKNNKYRILYDTSLTIVRCVDVNIKERLSDTFGRNVIYRDYYYYLANNIKYFYNYEGDTIYTNKRNDNVINSIDIPEYMEDTIFLPWNNHEFMYKDYFGYTYYVNTDCNGDLILYSKIGSNISPYANNFLIVKNDEIRIESKEENYLSKYEILKDSIPPLSDFVKMVLKL